MADLLCDTRRWWPPVVVPSSLQRASELSLPFWETRDALQRRLRRAYVCELNPAEATADAHGCDLA
jgi:hypothetical protein